ncbi:MAG: hypothetical protein ACRCY4_01600 [Brevinema sp.]
MKITNFILKMGMLITLSMCGLLPLSMEPIIDNESNGDFVGGNGSGSGNEDRTETEFVAALAGRRLYSGSTLLGSFSDNGLTLVAQSSSVLAAVRTASPHSFQSFNNQEAHFLGVTDNPEGGLIGSVTNVIFMSLNNDLVSGVFRSSRIHIITQPDPTIFTNTSEFNFTLK